MSSHLDHLRVLETAYWNDIVAHFEAMPQPQRPPAYKKYAYIREIIALSLLETTPVVPEAIPTSHTGLPRPRSLTNDAAKHAIHEGLASYFVRRQNKASLIRDALSTLIKQGVQVPGKSPASTLAALISRDSTGKYAKAGNGYWQLADMYYQKQVRQVQSIQGHLGSSRSIALV